MCQAVHAALSYLDLVTLSTTYELGSVISTSLQLRQRRNKVTKQPRSAVGSSPPGLGLRVHAPNQRASRPPLPGDARCSAREPISGLHFEPLTAVGRKWPPEGKSGRGRLVRLSRSQETTGQDRSRGPRKVTVSWGQRWWW